MQAIAVIAAGQQGVCAAPAAASPVAGTPVTVQFNQFQLGSNDLPLSDKLLAPSGGPNSPEQIHITLGSGPGQMYITWITGPAKLSASAPQAPANNLTSQVLLLRCSGLLESLVCCHAWAGLSVSTGNLQMCASTYLVHTLNPSASHAGAVWSPAR